MKRSQQLAPFPLGATLVFWAGMAFLGYAVYARIPLATVVAELWKLF